MSHNVLVVGAGIIGLTTAITLHRNNVHADLLSKQDLLSTLSANSGAVWGPFLSEHDARTAPWSYETLRALEQEALIEGSAVSLVDGCGYQKESRMDDAWWVARHPGAQESPHSIPGYEIGWDYHVPIVDMPQYLADLHGRLLRQGAELHHGDIRDFPYKERYDHIVMCTGLASADLFGDDALYPVRGQLVVVDNPGLTRFFAERGDGPDLTYILPQGDKVILGGTADSGLDCIPEDSITTAILNRCTRIEPSLAQATIQQNSSRTETLQANYKIGTLQKTVPRTAHRLQLRPRRRWSQPLLGLRASCPAPAACLLFIMNPSTSRQRVSYRQTPCLARPEPST